MRLKLRFTALLLALGIVGGGSAFAQGAASYPNKPIKIVVPFSAAGTTDILARAVANEMQKAWGQPVIVENRPGAGGNIGSDVVAKAAPDAAIPSL